MEGLYLIIYKTISFMKVSIYFAIGIQFNESIYSCNRFKPLICLIVITATNFILFVILIDSHSKRHPYSYINSIEQFIYKFEVYIMPVFRTWALLTIFGQGYDCNENFRTKYKGLYVIMIIESSMLALVHLFIMFPRDKICARDKINEANNVNKGNDVNEGNNSDNNQYAAINELSNEEGNGNHYQSGDLNAPSKK